MIRVDDKGDRPRCAALVIFFNTVYKNLTKGTVLAVRRPLSGFSYLLDSELFLKDEPYAYFEPGFKGIDIQPFLAGMGAVAGEETECDGGDAE